MSTDAVSGERLQQHKYKPAIRFNYDEAASLNAELLMTVAGGVDRKLIETANNQFTVYSQRDLGSSLNHLKLNLGAGKNVVYKLKYYSNTACTALVTEKTVTDPAGIELSSLLSPGTVTVLITPVVTDIATGNVVDIFLKTIRLDVTSLANVKNYQLDEIATRIINQEVQFSYLITEKLSDGSMIDAFVSAREIDSYIDTNSRIKAHTFPTPVDSDFERITILAHAVDSLSHERGDVPLNSLLTKNLQDDVAQPALLVVEPAAGVTLRPKSRVRLELDVQDDTTLARSIQLFENGTLVQEVAGQYQQTEFELFYEVPANYAGTELDLQLVVVDPNNNSRTEVLTFPVVPNEVPQLTLNTFSTYKVNELYTKVIDDQDRMNYAEFFVRVGEDFNLNTIIDDDVALSAYRVYRLDLSGQRILEFEHYYANSCPEEQVQHKEVDAEVNFNQIDPTQYEIVLLDTVGNEVRRTILVHPLTNMVPGIRITSPVDQQFIAAGTFLIKVGIVAADDRALSADNIEVYANGKRLEVLPGSSIGSGDEIGGTGIISPAFASIYDDIEQNYSVDFANDYGRVNSPFSIRKGCYMQVPAGLIKLNEPVTISAIIRDSDNAVARHDIEIQAAEILKIKELSAKILSENCGQTVEKILKDFNRDYWMDAEESVAYDIVDNIFKP